MGKCTSFKEKITKEINANLLRLQGSPSPYYEAMGSAIQRLHEAKEIDFMCRYFLLNLLRKTYLNSKKDSIPTEQELYQYSRYSEYNKNVISADFTTGRIMDIEGITFKDLDTFASKMDKAAKLQKQNSTNIENTMHHIWLTKTSNPRELFDSDIKNAVYNKNFLNKDNQTWLHVVWTNDKSLIPKSVKKLESNGIQVRSIYAYKDKLKLFDKIIELTEEGRFGMASDILRYSIIDAEGGVYADLNFRFEQGIKSYLQKYDFFSGDFQNNFFAAKPQHIIITETLQKIQDNLSNPPSYLNDFIGKITIQTTHLPFVLSIIRHANDEGNVDFYSDYYYAYGLNELDHGPIGKDNFGTSYTWKEEL